MSIRAVTRLVGDADVIRIPAKPKPASRHKKTASEEDEEEDQSSFGWHNQRRQPFTNPFGGVNLDDLDGDDVGAKRTSEDSGEEPPSSTPAAGETKVSGGKKKKKKKKKSKMPHNSGPSNAEQVKEQGEEDIDTVIQAVNKQFGDLPTSSGVSVPLVQHRTVLIVDRRNLNAENELKRIFGSKTVNSIKRKHHSKAHYRPSVLVHVKDNWPKQESLGLSMEMTETNKNSQCFQFKHSVAYQQVQMGFMQAVASLDHNNISAVLNAYPYHIDSLLQLSEVCRMTDDYQMGADLIERALYSFECSFHPLFNYTQGTCRLDYKYRENRSIYLILFRHIHTVSNRGCHRTALEFCKFLLGLSPEEDPLCVLLMVDYFSLRADDFEFMLTLVEEWESSRNLTLLPNIAFSLSLAYFHLSKKQDCSETRQKADDKLQNALIMFPMILHPLLDKLGVVAGGDVATSAHFQVNTHREPEALNILSLLFVERNHLLWKVPEVLLWLETNSRKVATRALTAEPLFEEFRKKRRSLYQGAPRNIYRHVVAAEFQSIVGLLPKDLTASPIMAFDPLPPANSVAAYIDMPPRPQANVAEESLVRLFMRSLLPSYNPETDTGPSVEGGQTATETAQYLAQRLRDVLRNLAPPPGADQEPRPLPPGGVDSDREDVLSDHSVD